MPLLAPKYGTVSKTGLLGRFVKYTLLLFEWMWFRVALLSVWWLTEWMCAGEDGASCDSCKMVALPRLLESRCQYLFLEYLFSLHRMMKQYCFTRQTILFDEPNTSVWHAKQYCFAHEKQLFCVYKCKIYGWNRRFVLIRFSIYSLEGSISQKYALAENAVLRNCVSRLGIFIAMCWSVKCRIDRCSSSCRA